MRGLNILSPIVVTVYETPSISTVSGISATVPVKLTLELSLAVLSSMVVYLKPSIVISAALTEIAKRHIIATAKIMPSKSFFFINFSFICRFV